MQILFSLYSLADLSDRPKKALSFTLAELARIQDENLDEESNPLHLRPDPARFVGFLRKINRAEVTFQVFLRLLKYQRKIEEDSDADPIR